MGPHLEGLLALEQLDLLVGHRLDEWQIAPTLTEQLDMCQSKVIIEYM